MLVEVLHSSFKSSALTPQSINRHQLNTTLILKSKCQSVYFMISLVLEGERRRMGMNRSGRISERICSENV